MNWKTVIKIVTWPISFMLFVAFFLIAVTASVCYDDMWEYLRRDIVVWWKSLNLFRSEK